MLWWDCGSLVVVAASEETQQANAAHVALPQCAKTGRA
jgi:hypothetical protein